MRRDFPHRTIGNAFGAAEFANDVRDAFSEATALGIRRQQPLGEAGLRQRPKSLRRGERYRGSVYLKGKAAGGMCVRLVDESGKVLCRADLRDIGPQWQKHAFQFVAPADVASAAMEIALPGRGDVRIDCLSLFSQSALDCGGFRPDLLQAIAALKPASIRYPGGCFASTYRWKDAVGPREKRKYCPASLWADRDSNQFGSDEFLLLCRKVGAEPVLVVNATRGIQETLDWIEYCNGEQGTTWGKRRADNGHPGPYRVKFWEIDNEAWPHMTAEAYAKIVTTFSQAIRAKDPALRIIACGGSDYDNGQSPQGKSYTDGWNQRLLQRAARDFDYLSLHYYNGEYIRRDHVEDPRAFEAYLQEEVGRLIRASANPAIQVYCSEWAMIDNDWRSGLYAGGILNGFERTGQLTTMSCPAVWLQTSPPRWPSSVVLFDHRTWYPAPTYVVEKLWRDHFAPKRVKLAGPARPLNAVATASADGKVLYFKVVNPHNRAITARVTVAAGFPVAAARMLVVAPGAEDAQNTLQQPDRIKPVSWAVDRRGQTVAITLPALSAGVMTITR